MRALQNPPQRRLHHTTAQIIYRCGANPRIMHVMIWHSEDTERLEMFHAALDTLRHQIDGAILAVEVAQGRPLDHQINEHSVWIH